MTRGTDVRGAVLQVAIVAIAVALLAGTATYAKKKKKQAASEPAPVICYDVALDGAVAYLGQTLGLSLWDLSDPMHPRATHRLELPAAVHGVVVRPPYVYLAAGAHGLYIARLVEDGPPEFVSRFDTPGKVRHVRSIGDYVLVADEKHGLLVVDVSDPKRPLQKAKIPTRDMVRSISLWGDVVALAEGAAGVRLFDMSRPERPIELALIRDVDDARDVDFDDRRLLVAAGKQGLRVYRFDKNWKAEFVADLAIRRSADYLGADRNVVLVSNATPTLFVVGLDEADRPALLTETRLHRSAPIHRVHVNGTVAFAALDRAGLSLIDIADPLSPDVLLPRERRMNVIWPKRDPDGDER